VTAVGWKLLDARIKVHKGLKRLEVQTSENQNEEPGRNKMLMQDWISTLLGSIDDQQDEATCRKIIRNCAEGFTEAMFSKVVGHPVKAEVVSSILSGDAGCLTPVVGNRSPDETDKKLYISCKII
jgi:hypothetical protein